LPQRCRWAAAHPEFTVGFLFAKVNPSEFSDGAAGRDAFCFLLLAACCVLLLMSD
jgi:hypothetical protein